MPSVNFIQFQLEELLSSGYYSSMIYNLNQFRTPSFDKRTKQREDSPYTAASIARQAAKAIVDSRALVDPIEVGELAGPTKLYRAHDGSSTSRTSAGTLGRFWVSSKLIENIWASTEGAAAGRTRRSQFKHLVRSCNLVLFEWNAMTHLACMHIPDGCRAVVVMGKGNWGAVLPRGNEGRGSAGGTTVDKSLSRQLSRMSTEPTTQYVVPLFNPNWVRPVTENESSWPLAS